MHALSFGDWLKRRRRSLDLTQDELADRTGCSIETIRKLEAETLRPSKGLAERLAVCLDLPPEQHAQFVRFARGQADMELLPVPTLTLDPPAPPRSAPSPTATSPLPLPPPVAASTRPSALPGAAHPPIAHHLPPQPTAFIGRESELSDIRRLLIGEPACRLLTLVGPGGIGKTRLAVEAAHRIGSAFSDGVSFVPLAPLTSPDQLVSAIAERLDVQFRGAGDPHQQLLDYVRARHLLLVMDNFEHVLDGNALVGDMLMAAPQITILTTSRERLNLSAEVIYPLSGMAVPTWDARQKALEYSAVQLLMQQARLVCPSLDLRTFDLDAMIRICQLVEGMPLALMLAAGWLEALPFSAIADEIAQSLDFLESQVRDTPERHRSVRATFDYSWQRLSLDEQQVFRQLAVFRGGFTRHAAQAVTGVSLRALRTLVNKSFISLGSTNRYIIHELLRQYGTEQLKAAGEVVAVHDRHLDFFLDLAETAESGLHTPEQKQWLDDLEQDHDNLRAALRWSLETRQAEKSQRLAGALWWFWDGRGHFNEARQWLEATLQVPDASGAGDAVRKTGTPTVVSQRARAKVLFGAGIFAWYHGDYAQARARLEASAALAQEAGDIWLQAYAFCRLDRLFMRLHEWPTARELAEQSVALFRSLGDAWGSSLPLRDLGWIALAEGDIPRARALLEEALALRRNVQDGLGVVDALVHVSDLHWVTGDYAQAVAVLSEALALSRDLRDTPDIAITLGRLGFVVLAQSDLDRAAAAFRESLVLRYELGMRDGIVENLAGLAGVAEANGDLDRAAVLLGAVEALFSPLDQFLAWTYHAWHNRLVTGTQRRLGEHRFGRLTAVGRTMTVEQVIPYALDTNPHVPISSG